MLAKRSRPTGYTLVELAIASVLATLLVAGMASSVYLASEALDVAESDATNRSRTARALDQLVRDLQHAREFTERTSTALTFTVPDRDGDGQYETLRYAWGGTAGDPVTFSMNGEQGVDLIDDVKSIDFTCLEREIEAREVEVISNPLVIYEGYADARLMYNGTSLSVALPADTAEGDLLVACMVTDGDTTSSLNIPAGGWNTSWISQQGGTVSLGIWWRIAGASEADPVGFTWSGGQQAYGWITRFTGHDPDSPINVMATAQGQADDPAAPAITTTADDCLVLRIGAFDDNDIDSPGDAGMSGHTTIVMRYSNTGSGTCSGGAAYFNKELHGTAFEAQFNAGGYEEYLTATLAIAPEPEEE